MDWFALNFSLSKAVAPEVVAKAPGNIPKPRSKLLTQRYYSTKPQGDSTEPSKKSSQNAHFTFKSTVGSASDKSFRRSIVMYSVATLVAVGGLSYAAVPVYKMFCAVTGYAGTTKVAGTSLLL